MICICDDCSQVFTIAAEGVTNTLPVRFCPMCGMPNLRKVKTVMAAMLKGRCFDGINPELVQLLLSVWSQERAGAAHPEYPRFIDYVKAQLS